MKYVFLTLFMCAYVTFCGDAFEEDTLVGLLIQEISHLAVKTAYPEKYLSGIRTNTGFSLGFLEKSLLEGSMTYQYELPPEVIEKFKAIAFATNLTFESFCVALSTNLAYLEEFVGSAYNDNGMVHFAYIRVQSYGDLIPQYEKVTTQDCNTYFIFWEKCKITEYYYPRGLTAEEVDVITNGMRQEAYNILNEKIKNISSKTQWVLPYDGNLYSRYRNFEMKLESDGLYVYHVIKDWPIDTYQPYWNLNIPTTKAIQPLSLEVLNDGNMVIKDNVGTMLWQTGTSGQGKSPIALVVLEDGNLVLLDRYYKPLWDAQNVFDQTNFVLPQEFYLFSNNGDYFLILQDDGNLLIYSLAGRNGSNKNKPIWSTNTSFITKEGDPNHEVMYNLILRQNGNLEIYDTNNSMIWQTYTGGRDVQKVQLSDQGHLVLFSSSNKIVWSSDPANQLSFLS